MRTLLVCLLLSAPASAAAPSLYDNIPDGAVLGGVVRTGALELLRSYFTQTPDMQRDVGAYLVKRVGFDLTRIDGAAFWSTQLGPQATMALFLRLPRAAALKGTPRGSYDGVDLVELDTKIVAAAVPGGIVLGDETEVRLGIAVAQHHSPSLGARSPLGAILAQAGNADLAAGLVAGSIRDPQVQAAMKQYGVDTLLFSLGGDGRIVLEADGDAARLKTAAQTMEVAMRFAIAQLKAQHDQALADDHGDIATGLGTVAAYHQVQALWNEAAPRVEGNRLICRYQLPKLKTSAMVLPMVGIAAAVAVPAFVKYQRRSKTVEATMNLRKLADEAAHYAGEQSAKKKARFTFPRSTGWTPATDCCSQPGGKCAPRAADWSNATFRALEFSMEDPYYYQYRVTSEGRGKKARITVEARGDLDCDQVRSSFKRVITIGDDGNAIVGPLQTSDDIE